MLSFDAADLKLAVRTVAQVKPLVNIVKSDASGSGFIFGTEPYFKIFKFLRCHSLAVVGDLDVQTSVLFKNFKQNNAAVFHSLKSVGNGVFYNWLDHQRKDLIL